MCWITDGHTIHPRVEGLLPQTGIEPTPFRNSASKVAGLPVHLTTPGLISDSLLQGTGYAIIRTEQDEKM